MMKIALFLAVGLVAVFNSPVTAARLSESDGQLLLDAITEEIANQNLQCADVDSYCSQNNPSHMPENICPAVLKAHLCDHVNSASGMIKVLEDLVKEPQEN